MINHNNITNYTIDHKDIECSLNNNSLLELIKAAELDHVDHIFDEIIFPMSNVRSSRTTIVTVLTCNKYISTVAMNAYVNSNCLKMASLREAIAVAIVSPRLQTQLKLLALNSSVTEKCLGVIVPALFGTRGWRGLGCYPQQVWSPEYAFVAIKDPEDKY